MRTKVRKKKKMKAFINGKTPPLFIFLDFPIRSLNILVL